MTELTAPALTSALSPHLLFDLIPIAILVLFICIGAKRGLFKTLSGLAVIAVALLGAAVISSTLADPVTELLYPRLEGTFVERVMNDYVSAGRALPTEEDPAPPVQEEALLPAQDAGEAPVQEAPTRSDPFGIKDAIDGAIDDIKTASTNAVRTAAKALLHTAVQGLLFLLSFLLLLALLAILCRSLNLVFKLPLLHGLNTVGGGLLGLVEGALVLFALVFVIRRVDPLLLPRYSEGTYVVAFFLNNTPRTLLAALLK